MSVPRQTATGKEGSAPVGVERHTLWVDPGGEQSLDPPDDDVHAVHVARLAAHAAEADLEIRAKFGQGRELVGLSIGSPTV